MSGGEGEGSAAVAKPADPSSGPVTAASGAATSPTIPAPPEGDLAVTMASPGLAGAPASGPTTTPEPAPVVSGSGAVLIPPPAGVPSIAGLPPASIGPTAIMPALGAECPACKKSNHPGAPQCVFCGSPLGAASQAPAKSGFGERSFNYSSDAPPSMRAAFLSFNDELPAQPAGDPLIGVIVADRYRIVEPLGRGGMGAVYKVEHIRIGKLLAMKLLTGELSRNPDVVRRFKLEALTVSKLSSPNTVQVFDFGAAEGLTYLVMELVSGEDLGRTLRLHGPMPWSRLGRIIVQICNSLAEAHQKGIVHRDIKPENVMLLRGKDNTDIAKVLDFGLAKLREGEGLNDVTSQGAIVGTPYFMAPEQIKGEAVDARTDVYALGALMYRALTGHYPFNGPTPMAVFTKHLTEPATPPIERAPDLEIPDGINQLVLKALSKNAENRFQKVEELQARLVEELKTMGNSSVEHLLDSGQLRRLAKAVPDAAEGVVVANAVEIATRDEVEAYERKLRRQRYGAFVGLFATLLIGGGIGAKLFQVQLRHARDFKGVEAEPNDSAKEANDLPLGRTVTGYLGKRLEIGRGDRDFYAVDVPASAPGKPGYLRIQVSGLPNFATCTMLYQQGFATALGQYCVGRPARDLVVPTLRVEPGHYLVAVLQDLDPYGKTDPPYIFENVSDPYTLSVAPTDPRPGFEIEPNDRVASAEQLAVDETITASINWAGDQDMFCVPESLPGKIRWKVRESGLRESGVLQATLMRGEEGGIPVRIHVAQSGKTNAADVLNPWISQAIGAESGVQRCLRVSLDKDPWSGERAGVVPNGGSETYVVEVEGLP